MSERHSRQQITPSARSAIAPFYVMEVMRAAEELEAAGRSIIHLEVGQPSTPAPSGVLDAAKAALNSDKLGYTAAKGIPELRTAIAAWYDTHYGHTVNPDRVIVTTGASGSCLLSFLALFDPGQRVGVLEPGYPCYRNDLEALGVDVIGIPLGHETSFRPTLNQIEAVGPLDGLIVASPSNPTGTILGRSLLNEISQWADDNETRLIVDEIYQGITFPSEMPGAEITGSFDTGVSDPGSSSAGSSFTALSISDNIVVFNSFSKYFSMTGWRLGWIVAPESLCQPIERLAQNFTISAPTLSQLAAQAAFDCVAELEDNVQRYSESRHVVFDGLQRAGLTETAPPDGAFYFWVDVSDLCQRLGVDSQALCHRWLHEAGVAITPGIDFDPQNGDRFVRLSYAGSPAEMKEGMNRLNDWLTNQ